LPVKRQAVIAFEYHKQIIEEAPMRLIRSKEIAVKTKAVKYS